MIPTIMDNVVHSARGGVAEAGSLPPWGVAKLSAPPPYSLKSALRVTGAGAIILGISIGSGEWLIGPAVTAQFTAALLWVATTSILLQWVFNEEVSRYTLYTGEPIMSGFMRNEARPRLLGLVLVHSGLRPVWLAGLGGLGGNRDRGSAHRRRSRTRHGGHGKSLGLHHVLRLPDSAAAKQKGRASA
jgi:hypothetical protein